MQFRHTLCSEGQAASELQLVKVGATYTSDHCLTQAFRIAIAYGRLDDSPAQDKGSAMP